MTRLHDSQNDMSGTPTSCDALAYWQYRRATLMEHLYRYIASEDYDPKQATIEADVIAGLDALIKSVGGAK